MVCNQQKHDCAIAHPISDAFNTRAVFPTSCRAGFTLIELLAVITLIGLLAGLLMPSLASLRRKGQQTTCANNLRQIGLAVRLYMEEYGITPPAYINATCRWMDLLKPLIPKQSAVFRCPSVLHPVPCQWDTEITLSYGVNSFNFAGRAHCFWYGVNESAISRPSGTIFLADCTPGKYYCGGGRHTEPVVDVDYRHPGNSFNALFCDGHVEPKSKTTQRDWDASQ